MATITCKQCGYVNEGERVYCHNCGIKLERPAGSGSVKDAAPVYSEQERKRIAKMANPSKGNPFRHIFRKVIVAMLWAALAAVIVQMIKPPKNVPSMPEDSVVDNIPQIDISLEDAMYSTNPQRLVLPEDMINGYLFNSIRSKSKNKYLIFKRAFVDLRPGVCNITMQQAAWDFPLYAGAGYELNIKDGKIHSKIVEGHIGRMPIHPMIMQFGDIIFQKLWVALKREKGLMDGMHAIEVQDQKIIITTKPM